MKQRMITLLFVIGLFLLIDYYVFQAVLTVSQHWSDTWRNAIRYGFWVPSILSVGVLLWWFLIGDPYKVSATTRTLIFTGLAAMYFSKFFAVLVLFVDDLQRGFRWIVSFFQSSGGNTSPGEIITRSEFLSKTALVVGTVPFAAMTYGILSGAHDYRVRRKTVYLPNLPKAFDGIKIGQLSDIHAGSFFNKTSLSCLLLG